MSFLNSYLHRSSFLKSVTRLSLQTCSVERSPRAKKTPGTGTAISIVVMATARKYRHCAARASAKWEATPTTSACTHASMVLYVLLHATYIRSWCCSFVRCDGCQCPSFSSSSLYFLVALVFLLVLAFLAFTGYLHYVHWKYSHIPQPKRSRWTNQRTYFVIIIVEYFIVVDSMNVRGLAMLFWCCN